MGVTATNVPEFRGQRSLSLSDLQDLAEVVKALMLQSDAPPGKVRTGAVKVPPAHDIPGSGLYFSGVFYEQPASRVARNGTIKDIHWASGIDRPAIARGHALLPLAETVDASGVALASPVAGGLSTVRVADSAISAPRILPGGILELPRSSGGGGDVPTANWGNDTPASYEYPGLIGGMSFDSQTGEPWAIAGHIYFPLAHYGTSVDGWPGALRSVKFASGVDLPRIEHGVLELPAGGSGGPAGVRDVNGSSIDWQALGGGAMRATVARIALQVSDSVTVPLALEVGQSGGYMTFALTS